MIFLLLVISRLLLVFLLFRLLLLLLVVLSRLLPVFLLFRLLLLLVLNSKRSAAEDRRCVFVATSRTKLILILIILLPLQSWPPLSHHEADHLSDLPPLLRPAQVHVALLPPNVVLPPPDIPLDLPSDIPLDLPSDDLPADIPSRPPAGIPSLPTVIPALPPRIQRITELSSSLASREARDEFKVKMNEDQKGRGSEDLRTIFTDRGLSLNDIDKLVPLLGLGDYDARYWEEEKNKLPIIELVQLPQKDSGVFEHCLRNPDFGLIIFRGCSLISESKFFKDVGVSTDYVSGTELFSVGPEVLAQLWQTHSVAEIKESQKIEDAKSRGGETQTEQKK
jgi:hypothetical protein